MDVPSSSPIPDNPDNYRSALNALADRHNLSYRCLEEFEPESRAWWARYSLINPNASDTDNYLGSSSGTTKHVAKEHAARTALGTLTTLIDGRARPRD